MKCCDLTPGMLRHKIEIRELQEVEDEYGGQVSTWVTVWTKKAFVKPVSGYERLRSAQLQASQTHVVYMRWFDGLTAKHQIKFGDRLFQIRFPKNVEERNRWLEVTCDEGVAQ